MNRRSQRRRLSACRSKFSPWLIGDASAAIIGFMYYQRKNLIVISGGIFSIAL